MACGAFHTAVVVGDSTKNLDLKSSANEP